jgi:glc operon protein GlcG
MRYLALVAAVVISTAMCVPKAGAQSNNPLNAAAARSIVEGCVKHSTNKKQSQAIAVVDASGGLLAFLRMDRTSPGVGAFAMQKAAAVASWRFSTEQMLQGSESVPGFADAPNVVIVPGGVPIYAPSGEFLGSVGVSGEDPADDATCAVAGIRAAGFVETRTKQ